MNSKITIRQIEEKDFCQVKELLLSMFMNHVQKEPSLLNWENLQKTNFKRVFSKFINKDNKRFFVAEISNEIVGTISAGIQKTPRFYNEKKEIYITDLVVKEGFRNNGIATKLINECIGFAKKNKINLINARIYEFNLGSRNLFIKNKFEPKFTYYYLKT
ncbi:MAG: GNAT family N-acetyltransferase [Patescibacteria group bacterium]|nr:GNAT family N-acetyltransferase [Patescibacteria group bacterium]MCL5093689.1 GNAT family N-acetyltransferase [Patescibacteria group bacterium]